MAGFFNKIREHFRAKKERAFFANKHYLTHKEKPDAIVITALGYNIISYYGGGLEKSIAAPLKDLVNTYNIKLIACTTEPYPSTGKEAELHEKLIASGISEVYFTGSDNRAIVTAEKLEKEKTEKMESQKHLAHEAVYQQSKLTEDKIIILDTFQQNTKYQFQKCINVEDVIDIISTLAKPRVV